MSSSLSQSAIKARLDIAKQLAKAAGDFVFEERRVKGTRGIGISEKGHQDFVTEMDKASEDLIREGLAKAFPDDGFVGEESEGFVRPTATWVVDPIDGTTNYIRGSDHWAISIALVSDTVVVAGVVYQASMQSLYWAELGQGAYKDGEKVRRPQEIRHNRSLAVVGYNHKMSIDEHCQLLNALHFAGFDFRNNGSAAMDLVHLAEGNVDLTFVHSLNSWDVLAALLIAEEAGAVGFCPAMPDFYFETGPVLGCDAGLANSVCELFRQRLPQITRTTRFNALDSDI